MTTETMTDLITAEEAKKLLDHYGLPTDCDCNDEDCVKCSHYPTLQERASKKLKEISPDLACTVIALHAQLADAQAAQAMVVERCAEEAVRTTAADGQRNIKDQWRAEIGEEVASAIRALAPIDGLALVRELRAESETRHQLHLEQVRITNEWIAERDRLASANAVLEAKVAGLVDALRNLVGPDCMYDGRNIIITAVNHGDAIRLVAEARVALATQEAGT